METAKRGGVFGGAARFGLVSLVVFATVAFAEAAMVRTLGLVGAYTVWTVLFLGGGGVLLAPLVPGFRRTVFVGWFTVAFLAYALLWCAAWFASPNRLGEWLGAIAGVAAMAGVLRRGGICTRPVWAATAVLALGNASGYFAGDALHNAWGRPWGMVAWGVLFGMGTGGALGWILCPPQGGKESTAQAG